VRWYRCLALRVLVTLAAATATATAKGAADPWPPAPPDPVLHYAVPDREMILGPRDITAIEISESGGITDLFLRLGPQATGRLAAFSQRAIGQPAVLHMCGIVMRRMVPAAANRSGTLYIPGTDAWRAEAMRALWHGRARCDTLGPEVFEHGN
jgi:hypothetical protein